MQKITPCLWFNDKAEEAANFYVSIFKKSKVIRISRYDKESAKVSGRPEGSILTVDFKIEGQHFIALNGGPEFKFSIATSFLIHCKNQEEIDYFWDRLSLSGQPLQCGWVTDKYGVTWQVVPDELDKMLADKDPMKSQRVMSAMLKMVKLDLAVLKNVYKGKN